MSLRDVSVLSPAYHTVCIDPWLTQNKRVCPVCKRRVFAAGERRALSDSSDAEPDADESQPLLRSAPSAVTIQLDADCTTPQLMSPVAD